MAGYSGTPLVRKLGIAADSVVALLGAPDDFTACSTGCPTASCSDRGRRATSTWPSPSRPSGPCSSGGCPLVLRGLRRDGAIWVAWPKKASKVPTDITEDVVRDVVLPIGLVDVKVCAIDETWSGLKVVWRKENR